MGRGRGAASDGGPGRALSRLAGHDHQGAARPGRRGIGAHRAQVGDVPGMNRDWMRERLESFKALCEAYDLESRRAGYAEFTDRQQAITDEMSSQMPTAREILKRLDPALAKDVELATHMGGASSSLQAVQQGLGILRDRAQWAANLAPDAPALIADQFHPHVWPAASP